MSIPTPVKGYDIREYVVETQQSSELIEIAYQTIPNRRLERHPEGDSGDYILVHQFTENRKGIMIADSNLPGKAGAEHARSICHQVLDLIRTRRYFDPCEALIKVAINEKQSDPFCSLLYVDVLNAGRGKAGVSMCSAGHFFPIVYSSSLRMDTGDYEYPKNRGPAIGLPIRKPKFPKTAALLRKDDYLVLFTDGITEAKDSENRELERHGLVGLIDSIISGGAQKPSQIVEEAMVALRICQDISKRSDDMSLAVIKIN